MYTVLVLHLSPYRLCKVLACWFLSCPCCRSIGARSPYSLRRWRSLRSVCSHQILLLANSYLGWVFRISIYVSLTKIYLLNPMRSEVVCTLKANPAPFPKWHAHRIKASLRPVLNVKINGCRCTNQLVLIFWANKFPLLTVCACMGSDTSFPSCRQIYLNTSVKCLSKNYQLNAGNLISMFESSLAVVLVAVTASNIELSWLVVSVSAAIQVSSWLLWGILHIDSATTSTPYWGYLCDSLHLSPSLHQHRAATRLQCPLQSWKLVPYWLRDVSRHDASLLYSNCRLCTFRMHFYIDLHYTLRANLLQIWLPNGLLVISHYVGR